jgi:hypothetical protein
MEITSEQAYVWAENHRSNTIRELGYLIEELEESRGWLLEGKGYTVDGSPETRLKQIRKEQFQAEALARLADHIRYEEAVEKNKA